MTEAGFRKRSGGAGKRGGRKAEAAPLPAWGEALWKKLAVYGALIAAPGTALLIAGLIWRADMALQNMEAAFPDAAEAPAAAAAPAAGAAQINAAAPAGGGLAFVQMPPRRNTALKRFGAHMQALHKKLLYLSLAGLIASISIVGSLLYFITRDKRHRSRCQTILAKADNAVESRVRHRTAQLEAAWQTAEKERRRAEFLLQDTSHRVGNSLAGVCSLLGLQLSRAHDEEARRALLSARDRVLAIASAHRRLRLNKDMETAATGDFLAAVIHDVESGLSKAQRSRISIETHFEHWFLPARDVITLGIILSELLINAVKHAFPGGRRGTIRVSFGKMRAKHLRLIVEDDGIGFAAPETGQAAAKTQSGEPGQGLGRLILAQLATQFGAAPHYAKSRKNGKSCGSRVSVPLLNVSPAARAEPARNIKKAAA